jgi:DNA topoisomerase-1
MISAGLGRYGSLRAARRHLRQPLDADEVFDVGINRAVTLLAEKRAGGGRPQRGEATALADLGAHPADGAPVKVLSGRYGPYIKHGDDQRQRAARPRTGVSLTLEEAVALLAEREAKGGGKKPAKQGGAPRRRLRRRKATRPRRRPRRSLPPKRAGGEEGRAEGGKVAASSDDGATPWDDESLVCRRAGGE